MTIMMIIHQLTLWNDDFNKSHWY